LLFYNFSNFLDPIFNIEMIHSVNPALFSLLLLNRNATFHLLTDYPLSEKIFLTPDLLNTSPFSIRKTLALFGFDLNC